MRNRTLFVLTAFATAAATLATGASAQELELEPDGTSKDVVESESGSYIVVMEEDPVVVSVGQEGLDTPVADGIAADLEADQDEVLEDIGADGSDKVNTYTNALNGFSAFLTYDEAQAIAADPKVALVLPDELHQADTNESPDYLGLTRKGGAYDSGITGEDVVVGVIDNGIWPEHPSFADDGSYGPHPIQPLDAGRPNCEFGNAGHTTDSSIGPDLPFTCNNKLLGARQMLDTYRTFIGATPFEYDSARDDDGHGTHTASTAAGNAGVNASMYGEDLGLVSGVAPRARVVAYKGLGALGGFTSDLAAAIDQAVSDGVDVINYSIGGGASLPVGADDIAFLFAADAGVFVATSAGNSGPDPDTVGSPGNAPWLTTVGANTQKRFYQGTVEYFGDDDDGDDGGDDDGDDGGDEDDRDDDDGDDGDDVRRRGVDATSEAGDDGDDVTRRRSAGDDGGDDDGDDDDEGGDRRRGDDDDDDDDGDDDDGDDDDGGQQVTGASLTPEAGRTTFVDAEDAGGDLCTPGSLDASIVAGTIVLCRRGAVGRAEKSEAVAMAGGVGMVLYNNDDDDSLFTDTHLVPSVHVNLTDGLTLKQYIDDQAAAGRPAEAAITDTGRETTASGAPNMTYFSSRGPNGPVPDIIKPDITAPGHQIVAGDAPGVNAVGDSFQAISGTSMSSPHVAGLFALLKQAHPDWSAAAARSAIMTTADTRVRSEDRRTQATPFEMGAGEIDPGRVDRRGSSFNPGLVYDAGLFEYAAFSCGADLGIFTPGSCAFLDGLGVPFDASDLNLPSIGVAELAGSQTVVRTVTSVADETVRYWARVQSPPGYRVSVEPKRFTVAPGESVDLAITITNVGAPAGEWRFGALHLRGRGYQVRSPIAVNGALFDAPSDVEGTGVAGSVDFDVLFGYDGSYTAAPHGLVPSVPKAGSIGQDPDQTYPSGDDEPGPDGGVDTFSIPLSDTAFFRVELAIPGPDDIDLFLEDSSGTIVASSTNGGTDELIELVLPPDDTYTLVVHGWGITVPPLPYSVDTWAVPLTPGGGSLVIDSAPGAAGNGTTGTVTASWSGLTGGTRYLGAVSHTGDAGLLGLTLVNVAA